MSKLRLAIISREDNNRYQCSKLLYNYDDVITEIYESFEKFRENSDEKQYSGIIVDLHTIIISSYREKEFFYSLSKGIPILTIDSGEEDFKMGFYLKGKYIIDKPQATNLIDYFIYEICAKNAPRKIRRYSRKEIYLNVILSTNNGGEKKRTNLLNLSEGGCFIIAPNSKEEYKSKNIEFIINDLEDKTPIIGEIKWVIRWGEIFSKLPGYAVEFKKISKNQKSEITNIINSFY